MRLIELIMVVLAVSSMMGTCFYLVQIVSKMKYNLYEILVSYAIRGDIRGLNWLKGNQTYLWYNLMLYGVIYYLLEVSWMMVRNDLNFSDMMMPFSPLIWVSLFFVIKGRCKRVLKRV